ncbi:MAG: hypothetical protein QM500_19775 [Methylococcales bacterium]
MSKGMSPAFIKKAIKADGRVITTHANGNTYYLDNVGEMQIDGEWYEAVMYHSLSPFGHYCRRIEDFKKFTYQCNETITGPR